MRRALRAILALAVAATTAAAAADAPAPLPEAGQAPVLRLATFHAPFSRRRPAELVRALERPEEPELRSALETLVAARADVVFLSRFDHDLTGIALDLLRARLAEAGLDYPHALHLPPNSGRRTGLDLTGDGRTDGPGDAQGYGWFSGQGGMALLSRLPISAEATRDHTELLWRDLPGARLPEREGAPFPSEAAQAIQRLFSVGFWDVTLDLPDGGGLRLLTLSATPPIASVPARRNLLRNRDELRAVALLLDGWQPNGRAPPARDAPLAVLGRLNADPGAGDGLDDGIGTLLAHPRLADPRPRDAAGTHTAAIGRATSGPRLLRLDYVLPDRRLTVVDAGILRSGPAAERGNHLVWVDILRPSPAP